MRSCSSNILGEDTPKNALFSRKKGIDETRAGSRNSAAAAAKKKEQKRVPRGYDEKVVRIRKLQFYDFPDMVFNSFIPEGQKFPLRETIARLMYPSGDKDEEAKVITIEIARELRKTFATGKIAEAMYKETADDKKEPVNPELMNAIDQATSSNTNIKKRAHLSGMLSDLRRLNKREAKRLLMVCTTLKPYSSKEIAAFVLSVMECCDRLGINEHFPELPQALAKVFDEALTSTWGVADGSDESAHFFFRRYGHLIKSYNVQLHADLNALTQAQGKNYTELLDVLHRSQESPLGRALFGWACPDAAEEYVKNLVNYHLSQLPCDRLLSKDDMESVVEVACADARRCVRFMEAMGQKARQIECMYRKWLVLVWVQSLEERVRFLVKAWVKTQAIGRQLRLMNWEGTYFPLEDDEIADEDVFEPNVVDGLNFARERVNKRLAKVESTDPNIHDLRGLLQKAKHLWMSDDAYFELEIALVDCVVGQQGIERVRALVLETLPNAHEKKVAEESYDQLAALSENQWIAFAPSGVTDDINTMLNVLFELKERRKPENIAILYSSDFLCKCHDQLNFFVRFEAGGVTLFGADALAATIDFWEGQLEKGIKVTLDDIQYVGIYDFLASCELQERAKQLQTEVQRRLALEEFEEDSNDEDSVCPVLGGADTPPLPAASLVTHPLVTRTRDDTPDPDAGIGQSVLVTSATLLPNHETQDDLLKDMMKRISGVVAPSRKRKANVAIAKQDLVQIPPPLRLGNATSEGFEPLSSEDHEEPPVVVAPPVKGGSAKAKNQHKEVAKQSNAAPKTQLAGKVAQPKKRASRPKAEGKTKVVRPAVGNETIAGTFAKSSASSSTTGSGASIPCV